MQLFQIKIREKVESKIESNVLCILLDKGEDKIEKADDELSYICMEAGVGTSIEGYLKYFPVYYVPKKNMVNNGRIKMYFDLRNGRENVHWNIFEPVIEKIKLDYGYSII